jgi:hypothetical protein
LNAALQDERVGGINGLSLSHAVPGERRFVLLVVSFANRATAAVFRRSVGLGGRAGMARSPEVTARRVVDEGEQIRRARRLRFFRRRLSVNKRPTRHCDGGPM